MHRIDAPGATIDELFTEGNPSLNIPATEVSDDWLNDVQEELALFIESQGITLVKGTQTQLTDAIANAIVQGGTQIKESIANASGPDDIAGLIVDKANFKAAVASFDLFRRTDSNNVKETGTLHITHNPETDAWDISAPSFFEDTGVVFSILASGQVQSTSDNLAGANYIGLIRITSFVKFDQ